jgi:hypothetical protein
MEGIINQNFIYSSDESILHRNIKRKTVFTSEDNMSAATITQARDKGLRHQFAGIASDLLDFCRKLYAAHGGATGARRGPAQVHALADRFEQYSPGLSAELRHLASGG